MSERKAELERASFGEERRGTHKLEKTAQLSDHEVEREGEKEVDINRRDGKKRESPLMQTLIF